MVAGHSLRRTGNRRKSAYSASSRDAQPSSAADDRRHRELVEEIQRQVIGDSTERKMGATEQRGWQLSTCQLYLVYHTVPQKGAVSNFANNFAKS